MVQSSMVWIRIIDQNYDDNYGDLAKDNNNNLIITGSTRNLAQFGEFTLNCNYSYPGFVVQLSDTLEENSYTSSDFEHLPVFDNNTLISYPNPFTTSTNIQYTLNAPHNVTIKFYNQFGKEVDRIEQHLSAGTQRILWTPELPGGIYYFRLEAGNMDAIGKVVLVN